jgi:hypothetical protein
VEVPEPPLSTASLCIPIAADPARCNEILELEAPYFVQAEGVERLLAHLRIVKQSRYCGGFGQSASIS